MDNQFSRRRFIKALTASGVGAWLASQPFALASESSEKVNISIIGAGLAGLASAHRLQRALPNATVTVIDEKQTHYYQPGYTLLATGVWNDAKKVTLKVADLLPVGCKWVQSNAKTINPDNQTIEVENGESVAYDYLIIATGLSLRYDLVEGLDISALGQNGLSSVYHSANGAVKSWQAMDEFRQKGGQAVMTLAPTPMKCAGAPLKMTFMLADRLEQAGKLNNSDIRFFAPSKTVFSVPVVNKNVLERWSNLKKPVDVNFESTLKSIDMQSKVATFTQAEGETRVDYDFIHIVPPMTAPSVIRESELVLTNGSDKGWLEVSPETLQHKKYPNIFGLGDVNGTPKGKTAATVKKSAPVMANNLLNTIRGKAPDMVFDGYTSCPLLIREGSAMLVEFNYKNELTPSIPMVDPLQESYFAWYLEEVMLKPAYISVLKGNA